MGKLLWDGSNLGSIADSDIIERISSESAVYLKFHWMGEVVSGKIRLYTTSAPNIIDEIKPLFNLPKTGTHRISYQGKDWLLLRARLSPRGNIQEELTLDKLPPSYATEIFRMQVRELFAFREVVGIGKSFESSIQVRVVGSRYFPLSYDEPTIHPAAYGKVLPETILDRWFGDSPLNLVVRQLLGIQELEMLPERIHRLRSDLERIVERVDREWIWCVDSIYQRILSRVY